MKKTREKQSFGTMSVDELQAQLKESQDGYFRLQFRHASNPLKNPMEIRAKRREVAQIKTWIHQKEAGAA